MEIAAQNERNSDYYRGLLIKCGNIIGDRAYISDDGSIQDEVLCAKIPELIKDIEERKKQAVELLKLIRNNLYL
jgi:hypothetical protein